MDSQLLKISLLITRVLTVWMMSIWALMRIFSSETAVGIASKYYGDTVTSLGNPFQLGLGVVLMVSYLLALIGFKKKVTYFVLFLAHFVGTLFVFTYSVPFFENFRPTWFTSWPALMAMFLLWVLRKEDTLLSLKGKWA